MGDAQNESARATVSRGKSWLNVACLIGLSGAIAGAFSPTAKVLHEQWLDSGLQTYTHGYLVVAICVWLLVRNREALANADIAPSTTAAGLLVVASFLWLIAYRAGIQTAQQIMVATVIALAALTALGWRAFTLVVFPFAYFVLAIRVWDFAIDILQAGTTAAVQLLLRVTSIPAFVENNHVYLAAGTFEIADGCSGLHFMIVGVALAALYGEMNRDSLRTRLGLIGLAVCLALLANWLRVYIIVVAGYLTDMQHYLVSVEHYRFGWVVFACSMTVFFLLARRFPLSSQQQKMGLQSAHAWPRVVPGLLLALIAALVGPAWNWVQPVRAASEAAEALPADFAGAATWKARFQGADLMRFGSMQIGGTTVELASVIYRSQTDGKEMLGYGNTLAPDAQIVSTMRIDSDGPIAESRVEQGQATYLMWHFYEVGGARTSQAWRAQLMYGYMSLLGTPESKVVAFRSACSSTCDAARLRLAEALRSYVGSRI